MKRAMLALALFGILAGNGLAQTLCGGAEGASKACAAACSNQVVNDLAGPSNPSVDGKFNVGYGNLGDGNDGFQNVGNFNIGSSNKGNCIQNTGAQGGGSCDPGNNAGQIVLRFCQIYYDDQKCQPGGYLAEYTEALIAAIPGVIAQCTGGAPAPPVPVTTTAASPPPPAGSTPPTTAVPPPPASTVAPGPTAQPVPVTPNVVLPPGMGQFTQVSSSQASLVELLELFEQHIAQEKALGRKLKL